MDQNLNKNNQSSSTEVPLLAKFYLEFTDFVRHSLADKIEKKKVEAMINRLIIIFEENLYNELLLYFYTCSRDNYIISHIANNTILAVGFGTSLGLSRAELMDLGLCAFCHDFGMAEYTHFFQKGHQLTEEENRMIQGHVFKSAERFKGIVSEKVIAAILDVHENINGQGYPHGKFGDEISFLAKMTAVCDVFEALTHPRNFRREFIPFEALKLIIKRKGKIFDGRIIKRFVEFMSIFPVGSLVYLNTGETAIVIGSNRGSPTQAIVRVLLTPKKEIEKSRKIVDLMKDTLVYMTEAIEAKEEKEILHFLKPRGKL